MRPRACTQTVDLTTANALAVLHACGRADVPVHRGQSKPLMRAAALCPEIHGDSGARRLCSCRCNGVGSFAVLKCDQTRRCLPYSPVHERSLASAPVQIIAVQPALRESGLGW